MFVRMTRPISVIRLMLDFGLRFSKSSQRAGLRPIPHERGRATECARFQRLPQLHQERHVRNAVGNRSFQPCQERHICRNTTNQGDKLRRSGIGLAHSPREHNPFMPLLRSLGIRRSRVLQRYRSYGARKRFPHRRVLQR